MPGKMILREPSQKPNLSRRERALRKAARRGSRKSLMSDSLNKALSWTKWTMLPFPLSEEEYGALANALALCPKNTRTALIIEMVLGYQKRGEALEFKDLAREAGKCLCKRYSVSRSFFYETNLFLSENGFDLRIKPFGSGRSAEIRVWRIPPYSVRRMNERRVHQPEITGNAERRKHPDDDTLFRFIEQYSRYLGGSADPQEKKIAQAVNSHLKQCEECSKKIGNTRTKGPGRSQ